MPTPTWLPDKAEYSVAAAILSSLVDRYSVMAVAAERPTSTLMCSIALSAH
jgi:hypothetical protein